MVPYFSRFLLSATSRYSRNLLKKCVIGKRDHVFLANSAKYTFGESIIQSKKITKRKYSCTSISRTAISNSSIEKLIQIQGLNIPFSNEDMKLALKPYVYASSVPKKESRACLIEGFNYWMNLPIDLCETIEQLFNMLCECELMVDDIYDESDYRRGLPTAYKLYGAPQTHISGRLCLFLVLKKLIELNNLKAIEAYSDNFIQHYIGEYKEIHVRDTRKCPTIEEYEEICVNKTQPVINTIIKFMQAFSDCEIDFNQLSRGLGIYYQYLNDVSPLCEPKCWNAKGFCTDISEGKYSLAIIHAINSGTQEGDLVSAIMHQKTKDLPTLKFCLSLLEKLGSIDFVKKTLTTIEQELNDEIERLGGNPVLVKFINTLTCMKYEEESEQSFL